MEFYSPQPEHAQLNTAGSSYNPKTNASHLLGLLQQQVLQVTDSRKGESEEEVPMGIDAALEDKAILSPPLSPALSSVEDEPEYILESLRLDESGKTSQDVAGGNAEGIVVKPSWRPGLSSRLYRHSTHGFLSEYRIFQNLTNNAGRANTIVPSVQNRSLRRSKVFKPTVSDFEKVSRTRRTVRSLSDDENAEVELGFKRPTTPRRPKKLAVHGHNHQLSSPLASANAVNSIPQYIPNMSWEKLPDYSPSVSTLPANNVKCLKVEWKGSPMDLSNDPLRNKLHPAELLLAQVLRLPCDLYLDSKRRLFLEKTHRLKQGLPFRRTDAQKACRIDVNKASRLYAAFEKVGWLEDSNFTKYL